MIKVFALIPKRPDISDEQFHAHWLDPHGVLAQKIQTIRRYVQSHGVASPPPVDGLEPAIYHGIAEVWFDSLEIALGMGADPNYTEYAGADEPNFIDVDRLAFLFADERAEPAEPVGGKDDHPVKTMLLLARREGVERGRFREALEALLRDAAGEGIERRAISTAIAEAHADAPPPFEGVVELSFADPASLERHWRDAGARQLSALEAVADLSSSASLVAEEHRLVWG